MNLSQIFWRHLFGDERHHRSFILTIYAIFSKYRHYKYFWNNYHIGVGQIFRSGPGGTITASTTATYTVGVTSNVSASITTGQIVKASISAGFSNSTSSSRSTSYKYSRSISPGRYGNMQYGNYGAQVNVKKPPLSLHAMSKCSLLEAQSCPVRTYGVTDIGKARPL